MRKKVIYMLETKGSKSGRLTLLEAGMWVLDLSCCPGCSWIRRKETRVVFLVLGSKEREKCWVGVSLGFGFEGEKQVWCFFDWIRKPRRVELCLFVCFSSPNIC